MMKPYVCRVTGQLPDGRRINRRYRTMAGAEKMIKRLKWASCQLFFKFTREELTEAMNTQ